MGQFGRHHDPEFHGIRNWESKKGGKENVTWKDTIGQPDKCWCGLEIDHDWPGKADKQPHPREDNK